MFREFEQQLSEAFQGPLPGAAGQQALKPYLKIHPKLEAPRLLPPKTGAVMALIYPEKNIPHMLFIERPTYEGVHSGQIAFPGGKVESSDPSFLHAALRETQEEVGIDPDSVRVIGPLTEVFVLASNFLVYPYVGILQHKPDLVLDQKEVAGTLHVPMTTFFGPGIIKEKPMKNPLGFTLMAPYYDIEGKILWGATAMMVSELCSVIQSNNIALPLR